jgi:hypothetical protein
VWHPVLLERAFQGRTVSELLPLLCAGREALELHRLRNAGPPISQLGTPLPERWE